MNSNENLVLSPDCHYQGANGSLVTLVNILGIGDRFSASQSEFTIAHGQKMIYTHMIQSNLRTSPTGSFAASQLVKSAMIRIIMIAKLYQ